MIGYVDILHLLLLYFSFENTTGIQILRNETLFCIFDYVHGSKLALDIQWYYHLSEFISLDGQKKHLAVDNQLVVKVKNFSLNT